ncbi:MAG: hypothetical protein ACTSWW_03965 [Promethearchaeota archaeon]
MEDAKTEETYQITQEERDSWYQYRRGLRPEDRPFFDEVFNASSHIPDSFLRTRLLASEGIFMASTVSREKQLHNLMERVKTLETL